MIAMPIFGSLNIKKGECTSPYQWLVCDFVGGYYTQSTTPYQTQIDKGRVKGELTSFL